MAGKGRDNLTFLVLRRLAEAAWDEGDLLRLSVLSAALDQYMLEKIASGTESIQAIR